MTIKPNKLIGKSIKRPTLSTSGTKKPIAKLGMPTTTNAAKTNLLKKKNAVDKARAIVKGGKSSVTAGYKELRTAQYPSDKQVTYDKIAMGEKSQKVGRILAGKAAQPYGEAVRTNRRVQAQAKRKTKQGDITMPKVGMKVFPYTLEGKKAAKKAVAKQAIAKKMPKRMAMKKMGPKK